MSEPVEIDDEFASLDYEEDCYFAFAEKSETPSFDIDDNTWEEENDCMFVLVDEDYEGPPSIDAGESFAIETEFYNKKTKNNKFIRAVRVRFQDLSKPYLAKITSQKNYTKFLQLVKGDGPQSDLSPDSGINELAGMSPEDQDRQKQEWAQELAKLEEEIQTLRQVLGSKVKAQQELKRKLGFSVWKEFQDDMSQGIRNVKESNVFQTVEEKVGEFSRAVVSAPIYQKTESVIKATTEKTSSLLGGLGSGITTKFGQLKNSESFRSFEEKVGSAYENVKTRVVTSRSSSMQSFDESLRRHGEGGDTISSPTTPTIGEERSS